MRNNKGNDKGKLEIKKAQLMTNKINPTYTNNKALKTALLKNRKRYKSFLLQNYSYLDFVSL